MAEKPIKKEIYPQLISIPSFTLMPWLKPAQAVLWRKTLRQLIRLFYALALERGFLWEVNPNFKAMTEVVCAVIWRGSEVLAAQRGPGQDQTGQWEFPGGKVGPSESPEAALIREIEEELGMKITVREAWQPSMGFTSSGKKIRLQPFLCIAEKEGYDLREHQAVKWVNAEEILMLDWCPVDVPVADFTRHWLLTSPQRP